MLVVKRISQNIFETKHVDAYGTRTVLLMKNEKRFRSFTKKPIFFEISTQPAHA